MKQQHLKEFIKKKTDNLFIQVESLLGLYKELKITKSLPKTRKWAGSPDFLLYTARIVKQNKPFVIVECGSGVSTVVLAKCLKLNGQGHIYSLEQDPICAAQTRTKLNRYELEEWVTIIDTPLVKHQINGQEWLWYSLENLRDALIIDMILIDGPPWFIGKMARYPAGPLLFNKLNKSGVVILDDAAREDEQEIINKWKDEFPDINVSDINCEKGCCLLTFS